MSEDLSIREQIMERGKKLKNNLESVYTPLALILKDNTYSAKEDSNIKLLEQKLENIEQGKSININKDFIEETFKKIEDNILKKIKGTHGNVMRDDDGDKGLNEEAIVKKRVKKAKDNFYIQLVEVGLDITLEEQLAIIKMDEADASKVKPSNDITQAKEVKPYERNLKNGAFAEAFSSR